MSDGAAFTGERLHGSDPLFAVDWARHEAAYRALLREPHPGRLLDLGCGSGLGTSRLAERLELAVGVDRVAPDAAAARSRAHYVRADLAALPFAGQSFDRVASFQVIEHFGDPTPYLTELRRVLRDGGECWITTPNALSSDGVNPYHVHEYQADELHTCLARFFGQVEIQGVGASDAVRRYYRARDRRVAGILRLDPLRLRERLPRALVERLFALGAVLVRRLARSGEGLPAVSWRDYPVGPYTADCLDLLARCRA